MQRESIEFWFLFMAGETLFRAAFFAQFLVLNFFSARVLIQGDAIFIKLVSEPLHVFHHIMEFGVVLDALGRAAFQFLNKQRMTIRPFGIARFWHFVVWQTILQCAFTKLGK